LAFSLAPLLLAIGDIEGYVEHRRRMLQRWGQTKDAQQAERTAKVCSLREIGDKEAAVVLELAQRAVRQVEARSDGPQVLGWCKLAEGLALYRCRRHANAVKCALVVGNTTGLGANFVKAAHFIRAMSLHHLKRPTEARTAFNEAQAIPSPEEGTPDCMPTWNDWLICRFLQTEAEALLSSKK
jgi:hypothetical protein